MSSKLTIAIATISDTRTLANDTSGDYLQQAACAAGHEIYERAICLDDIYQIRAQISEWIANSEIHVILLTGGTGFSGRDSTPEAISCLLDKHIDGFGEAFRYHSLLEIGSSTIQSRALAGLANNTCIFCLPGSPGACKTGWESIIRQQLDGDHRPCNFVKLLTEGKYKSSS